jgi:hypothetical protein
MPSRRCCTPASGSASPSATPRPTPAHELRVHLADRAPVHTNPAHRARGATGRVGRGPIDRQ